MNLLRRKKKAPAKDPRQDRYDVLISPRMESIFRMASEGATKTQICQHLAVRVDDFTLFCKEHPTLNDAYEEGRATADGFVENALFERAKGCKVTEVSTTVLPEGGSMKKTTVKQLPPDVTACTIWLKNRQPDVWRDKQELEITTPKSLAAFVKMTVEPGTAQIEDQTGE